MQMSYLTRFFFNQANHCIKTAVAAFALFLLGIGLLGTLGLLTLWCLDNVFHHQPGGVIPAILSVCLCVLAAMASATMTEDLFAATYELCQEFKSAKARLIHGLHSNMWRGFLLFLLSLLVFVVLLATSAIAWYLTHLLVDCFPRLYATHLGKHMVLGEITLASFAGLDLGVFGTFAVMMRNGSLDTPDV